MTPPETQPRRLETSGGTYTLHEFHLAAAGREWTVLHTGVVLTHEDEAHFLRELRGHLPYGVALWPSAIALAHELAARGVDALAGTSVLELGAGTGLPGIVAASLGAQVVQTDRQDAALSVCRLNGKRNGVEAGIDYRLVDWTDWHDDGQRFDWIIGSDILYGEPMHPHLRHVFQTSLAPGGRILLSDPFRGPSLCLLEALQDQKWSVAGTKWNLGEDEDPRAIGVFELAR